MLLFADAAPSKTVREPTNLLHYDDREFILFGFWKSGTVLGLIGSMLIIMLIGILYEAIRAFRVFMAQNGDSNMDAVSNEDLCPRSSHSNNSESSASFIKVAFKSITKQRIINALLYGAEMAVLCILILFVATFNIWVIFAVIMGCTIGFFLFTGSLNVNTPVHNPASNLSVAYSTVSPRRH